MEHEVAERIGEIERRANSVNITLGRICRTAGIRQNNLSRWKQGLLPTMRVFARDFPKLEQALGELEREMAIKLISRINPTAAPRIIALLQTPNAGGPEDIPRKDPLIQDQARDSRESTGNARYPDGPRKAGGSDRAA